MTALLGTLIGVVLVQFGLLWYKMGSLERWVKELNHRVKQED